MKVIWSGIESSGKSLQLAMKSREILKRNIKWAYKTGVPRTIASNMEYSLEFEKIITKSGIPLKYWKDVEELGDLTETDVFIDEIVNYFDARRWADLSLDIRRWLTQGAKLGIHIYGACQDFSQVDKSFRLLVNELYHVTKLIGSPRPMKTRPKVKRIWGLCMVRTMNPREFKSDSASMEAKGIPTFFLIQKEDCVIFNTSQKIARSEAPPLKKITRHWYDENGEIGHTITKYV